MPRTAIAREQKQFIKIAFAVHLSAAISAERYRSDSVTLKSAVSVFVYLCIVLMVHKYRQSAAQSCLRKKLSLSEITTDRTFENRRGKYKELGKKVPQAYRVYVKLILRSDAVIARIFVNVELDTETGLYYYGARYLDPKYSRWLSGDPAITDYMAGTSAGEGGIYNTVNLHVYHYAGNNPVKYTDPDGRTAFDANGNEHKLKQSMNTSKAGLEFIKSYEKLVLKPYNDGYGNWTIGYGHKITAKEAEAMKNGIDVDTADKFFQQDIKWIEDGINKNFDGVAPLLQNEFDALVSLGFNVGRHELVNSEIFDYAEVTDPSYFKNKHDSSAYEKAITNKFREYNNANKKYSLGLDKRRIDEAEMFFYGDYIRDNKIIKVLAE